MENVTSDDLAEFLRKKITDFATHNISYYGPVLAQPPEEGTSHVSLLAPNGDAVSVTDTINEWCVCCSTRILSFHLPAFL